MPNDLPAVCNEPATGGGYGAGLEERFVFANCARRFPLQRCMAERKQFRIRTSRFSNRAGKRETYRIAVSMPQRRHGTDGPPDRVLDDAEKIFEALVQSGRLARKK